MNEINILRILYTNRVRLLAVSLSIGIIAGAVSLLSPNKYSSTAAVSVQRPEVPITGEISPLRVETLRALVESTRVKRDLFDSLSEDGKIDDGLGFRRFLRMLSTQVGYEEGRERGLLPLVKLTATTSDPVLSKMVADRWAKVVLDKTSQIYQSGVGELGNFTARMYEEVNKSLLESEDRYAEIRQGASLTVNRLLLEKNQELYARLSLEVLSLEETVSTIRAVLEYLKTSLAGQEIDGVWAGEIFARQLNDNPDLLPPHSDDLAGRVARTIRRLKSNEETLAEFEESSGLNNKHIMLKIKKQQIEEVAAAVLQARTELSSKEPTMAKLREEMSDIDEKIVMSKAIGDDKLWETYLESGSKKLSELPMLRTESPNPVYEETQKVMVNLSAEISGLKSNISRGEEEMENLRAEVLKLTREISPLESRRINLQSAVNKDRELLSYYEQAYKGDRQKVETSEKELAGKEAELTPKKLRLEEVAREIARLEQGVLAAETRLSRQEREIGNLTEVHSSLASRAEEVALLRISMENISRSGTVLLYGAEVDPVKVGPNRVRVVLITIILVFLLYSLVLVLPAVVARDDQAIPSGREEAAPAPASK